MSWSLNNHLSKDFFFKKHAKHNK